jgi:hypothetical protein
MTTRIMRYFRLLYNSLFGLSVLLLGFLAHEGNCSEALPARYSAAELRSMLRKDQRHLWALYVVYRSEVYTNPDALPGTYMRRVLAAKAPSLLYNELSHPSEEIDSANDPLLQRDIVMPKVCYVFFPFRCEYSRISLKPSDPLPGTLNHLDFFMTTGLWPLKQRPGPKFGELPCALQEVALAKAYSVVRPSQEKVEGHWCHVLERPGEDRLWIDVSRGCCLLAREFCNPKVGSAALRYELGDHQEVERGIWIPKRISGIIYNATALNPEERKQCVDDWTLTVLEARVNGQVDDALFQFRPSPGALYVEPGAFPKQTEPGGLELLDDLVYWIRQHIRPRKQQGHTWTIYVLIGLPILAIGSWELLLRHQRRSRHASSGPS